MNKKQKILIAGAALFAALFFFSGVMLAWQYADGKQSADAFDAVADLIQPVETPQPGTASGIGDSTEGPDLELVALKNTRRFTNRTAILWAGSPLTAQTSIIPSCRPSTNRTSI